MKKLNITKERFEKSPYFQKKYGKFEYVSESGKLFKTDKGKVLIFKESKDFDKWIMPDDAENRKPIAVAFVEKGEKGFRIVHQISRCYDDVEKEMYKEVMTSGQAIIDDDTGLIAVPWLKTGCPRKYKSLIRR